YPNRDIPGFLKKNQVDEFAARTLAAQVAGSEAEEQFSRILAADKNGGWHFCADFRNAGVLRAAAEALPAAPSAALGDLFERTFTQREFTGRSGTFFAYEGLGSIYWHMVSKLLLSVQEQLLRAYDRASPPQVCKKLAAAYQEIRNGLSFNKSPREYGAFPCDPYSHTP